MRSTQKQSDSVQVALQAVSTAPQGSRLLPRASRDPHQRRNRGGRRGPHTGPGSSNAWMVKKGTAASAPSSSSGERHHCFTPWRSSPKLNRERCSPVARQDHTAIHLCTLCTVSCGRGWEGDVWTQSDPAGRLPALPGHLREAPSSPGKKATFLSCFGAGISPAGRGPLSLFSAEDAVGP